MLSIILDIILFFVAKEPFLFHAQLFVAVVLKFQDLSYDSY